MHLYFYSEVYINFLLNCFTSDYCYCTFQFVLDGIALFYIYITIMLLMHNLYWSFTVSCCCILWKRSTILFYDKVRFISLDLDQNTTRKCWNSPSKTFFFFICGLIQIFHHFIVYFIAKNIQNEKSFQNEKKNGTYHSENVKQNFYMCWFFWFLSLTPTPKK